MALVLIADDSPTDQHILSRALEQEGYETLVASDGAEALALAEQRAPDVILMDVVMPGMNGYQATRQLARNPSTASIPVVMVSTKGQDTDRAWGLRQGAVSYLTKPVTAADLVAAIRAALD
ncbi:MAG: response regulator [Chromatiales bacterium]|jgi:twitching motility two-component system response regulator PilH|nr:response regulator [Chromatiales bacterium]